MIRVVVSFKCLPNFDFVKGANTTDSLNRSSVQRGWWPCLYWLERCPFNPSFGHFRNELAFILEGVFHHWGCYLHAEVVLVREEDGLEGVKNKRISYRVQNIKTPFRYCRRNKKEVKCNLVLLFIDFPTSSSKFSR